MTGEQKLEAGAIRQLVISKELELHAKDWKNLSDGNIYKNRPVKNTKSSALCMKQDIY